MLRLPQVDPTSKWVYYYTKTFLVRELNVLFNRLRMEDQLLSAEDVSKIPDDILSRICFDRGIDLDKSHREQVEDLRLWLSISNLRNVPHTLLLITRVNDFAGEDILNDEDAYHDEVIRRRIFNEKEHSQMKQFEKAFSIDVIESLVTKIVKNRSEIEFAPEKGQFQFDPKDLTTYSGALDDF